jgi:hypothetical protein
MTDSDAAAQTPAAQGWCVCGQKVAIAEAREITLPNGKPGWEGYCPECGSPIFAVRRNKPATA